MRGTKSAPAEEMESWRVVEIVLVSVLVGTLLPVLFQLRSTLKAAEQFIVAAGPRLDRSLTDIAAAADRIDRVGATVERLTSSISLAAKLGAAVGPAVAAAVRAFRAPAEGAADESLPAQTNGVADGAPSHKEVARGS